MRRIMAVDPGREKCGLAVVEHGGVVVFRTIVHVDRLVDTAAQVIRQLEPEAVVLGNRTGSGDAARRLAELPEVRALGGVRVVDESFTSLEARRRYFQAHPARGLWRFVPVGLRLPPEPVDDWAAVVLAERYLKGPG